MRTRAALIVLGALAMAYAVGGALTDRDLNPGGVLVFLAGVLIAHDAVWMPLVLGVGVAVNRFVPRRNRTAVRTGAIIAAAVAVVAYPQIPGLGHPPGNLAVLLLVIAGATLVTSWWRGGPSNGRKKSERPGEGGAAPPGR